MSVVNSILDGVGALSASLVKVFTKPKIGPKVGKELDLVIRWKDAVQDVKNDVFDADLTDREEGEDKDLYEEIQGMIEDDDMEDVYKAFDGLKDAAQAYLDAVKESCPTCIVQ